MMNSYDVIAEAVKDYWKVNYPQDVIAFFQQKYSWDDKWERCEELVECHGCDDYENMTFLYDFCEGQTEVKDVVIIPLREITAFYYNRKIEKHESKPISNANHVHAMTDEELADLLCDHACMLCPLPDKCDGRMEIGRTACYERWLDWLKQKVTEE